MKKVFLSIMLLLVMAVLISGCGGADAEVVDPVPVTEETTVEAPTTIEVALLSTDRTKDAVISDGMGKDGAVELIVDSKIGDYSAKSSAYATCYDGCEALKNVPDLQNYGSVLFNFNGESLMQDGSTQMMPMIRLRYTTEQINNFDFASRDYVGFESLADVIKMDVK